MKRMTTFLAGLLLISSLWPQVTVAQQIQMAPNTVFCNLGTKTQPGYACPLTNFWNYIVQYVGPFFGVDQNILNKQIANYTIASTDCGKTVEMGTGSTGFRTVTIPAVTGFPGTCSVKIVNGDSTNGKAISGLTGIPSNMLWPGQAATVKIVNGAWYWTEKPGAWVLTSAVTFNVDPVAGCASATVPTCDGLGTGADAFNAVQTAVSLSLAQINFNGQSGTVLLADGTYTEQITCAGKFIGNTEITIQGASGHTASVIWNVALTGLGSGFFIKDYCALWLDNMTMNVANGANGIVTQLFGNVDVGGGMAFGSAAGAQGTMGTAISIGSMGYGSAVGNFAINGSFNWFLLGQGGSWTFSGRTITGASSLTFASAFVGGFLNSQINASSATFSGFSGVSGFKFKLFTGASLSTNGVDPNTIFPGSANGIANGSNFDGGPYSTSNPGFLSVAIANINFNSANTDTAFVIPLPAGFSTYQIQSIKISSASGTLTTATCAVYTGAGAAGTQIVASGTGVTVSTAAANTANNMQTLTLQNVGSTQSINYSALYFRVQTQEGSAATATVTITYQPTS